MRPIKLFMTKFDSEISGFPSRIVMNITHAMLHLKDVRKKRGDRQLSVYRNVPTYNELCISEHPTEHIISVELLSQA
jgi:hypothetical protein